MKMARCSARLLESRFHLRLPKASVADAQGGKIRIIRAPAQNPSYRSQKRAQNGKMTVCNETYTLVFKLLLLDEFRNLA